MAYQVISRKWRPQNFNDVVFQDHISKTIKNSIKMGRIPHAYIFSGPKGVGKTTMARILSKALNCLKGPTDDPCGECENCIEIKDGISFDVIEIDGASNRGIDNIRELRENVNFAPMKSNYKVYIIDEVHMLTRDAFNALLKTLEEPPAHIIFIFATTQIHQIPDTILSRCQKYFFKKIPIEAIVKHLKFIAENEGFIIDETTLYPVARASEGSMRDSQSILDQIISFSDGEITLEKTISILGVVPLESYLKLIQYIYNLDALKAIDEVDRIVMIGVDIPRYVDGFMDIIRTIRLVNHGFSINTILGFSDEEVADIKNIADKSFDEELSILFRIATDLQNALRFSNNERICLEMAILDMISAKKSPSISSILQKLEGLNNNTEAISNKLNTSQTNSHKNSNPLVKDSQEKKIIISESDNQPNVQIGGGEDAREPITLTNKVLKKQWQDLLSRIKDKKTFLFDHLKDSHIVLKNKIVHIQFPDGLTPEFHSKILEKKDLSFIQDELSNIFKRDIVVSVVNDGIGADRKSIKEDPSLNNSMPKNDKQVGLEKLRPTVKKVKDLFHGKIIEKGE